MDRNGNATAVGAYESGWKDNVYLIRGVSVSFVAKFDDFADAIHPYMYHCHFSGHEDGGMMGQFVVTNTTGVQDVVKQNTAFSVFPNPVSDRLYFKFENPETEVYYVTIRDAVGRAVMMLPQPEIQKGINTALLAKGIYFVQMMDKKTKTLSTQKFVKN